MAAGVRLTLRGRLPAGELKSRSSRRGVPESSAETWGRRWALLDTQRIRLEAESVHPPARVFSASALRARVKGSCAHPPSPRRAGGCGRASSVAMPRGSGRSNLISAILIGAAQRRQVGDAGARFPPVLEQVKMDAASRLDPTRRRVGQNHAIPLSIVMPDPSGSMSEASAAAFSLGNSGKRTPRICSATINS